MSSFRRRVFAALVFALPCLFAVNIGPSAAAVEAAPATDEAAARALVASLNDVLLNTMKNAKSLGIMGRYEKLAPQIKQRFDFRVMVAIASGSAWTKASEPQRDKLTDAFGKFSIATYADQFDSFDGQSFTITSVKPGPRGTMIVDTDLNQPNDSPVQLAYVLRKNDGGWQIIDVLAENGISQLAVRRSEYRSLLDQKGVPGLIAELDSRTSKLLHQ
jgi:phospholipid transport system substrate-binding protein